MLARLTQQRSVWLPIAVVLLLLVAWRLEKYFVLLYYRIQPRPAMRLATSMPEPLTIVIAFDEGASAANHFYSADGEPWESHHRHRLRINFGADAPRFDVESFNTLIDYKDGRLDWVKFYPFLPPVSYGVALSSLSTLFSSYGIQDRVMWSKYETRLDARADGTETYLPTVEFSAASLTAYLNCRWDDYEIARAQIAHVKCAPHLVLVAKSRQMAPVQTPTQ